MNAKTEYIPDAKESSFKVVPDDMPVSGEEFAALMNRFAPRPARLAIAVSGGPDSMALAFCVKRWRDRNPNTETLALIVDHGLRKESAYEAAQTKNHLAQLGINAEILSWQHETPVVTKLHATARKARYRLLAEACRRHNISDLLLGHQRDDQAETILMRFAKGSGIDGLGGMSMRSEVEETRILRPFLSIPRARLIATCNAAKISFVTDASNASEKFARGRLRRVLPQLAAEGFTVERLIDLGARANEARDALDHYTNMLLRVAGRMDVAGTIRLDIEQFRSAPKAIAQRALIAALQFANAAEYAPERASLTALSTALCADAEMPPRTLHGCLIAKNGSEASIMREFSAITETPSIKPGDSILWDNRWQVTLAPDASDTFTVQPLGNPPHALVDELAPTLRKRIPQGRARACLPSLWRNEKLALIPVLPDADYAGPATARLSTVWPPMGTYGNASIND
jgi:tRNA(Ile)-lysidine synthase